MKNKTKQKLKHPAGWKVQASMYTITTIANKLNVDAATVQMAFQEAWEAAGQMDELMARVEYSNASKADADRLVKLQNLVKASAGYKALMSEDKSFFDHLSEDQVCVLFTKKRNFLTDGKYHFENLLNGLKMDEAKLFFSMDDLTEVVPAGKKQHTLTYGNSEEVIKALTEIVEFNFSKEGQKKNRRNDCLVIKNKVGVYAQYTPEYLSDILNILKVEKSEVAALGFDATKSNEFFGNDVPFIANDIRKVKGNFLPTSYDLKKPEAKQAAAQNPVVENQNQIDVESNVDQTPVQIETETNPSKEEKQMNKVYTPAAIIADSLYTFESELVSMFNLDPVMVLKAYNTEEYRNFRHEEFNKSLVTANHFLNLEALNTVSQDEMIQLIAEEQERFVNAHVELINQIISDLTLPVVSNEIQTPVENFQETKVEIQEEEIVVAAEKSEPMIIYVETSSDEPVEVLVSHEVETFTQSVAAVEAAPAQEVVVEVAPVETPVQETETTPAVETVVETEPAQEIPVQEPVQEVKEVKEVSRRRDALDWMLKLQSWGMPNLPETKVDSEASEKSEPLTSGEAYVDDQGYLVSTNYEQEQSEGFTITYSIATKRNSFTNMTETKIVYVEDAQYIARQEARMEKARISRELW
jgi:hypothetical protein